MDLRLCAPCHFGLEGPVGAELRRMGFQNVTGENGRVLFDGDEAGIARANVGLACAERVLVLCARYRAETFTDLFDGVRAVNWADFLPRDGAFVVTGHCVGSKLFSESDCQSIIKKAIAESLKQSYRLSWMPETGARHAIRFHILKDEASIYIDTSGEGLHKRGYRAVAGEAPISETLAAAIADFAHFDGSRPLYDPFCGSGTLLIEAAFRATHRAPGLYRSFAGENYAFLPARLWAEAREAAAARILDIPLELHGSDIDPRMCVRTKENAKLARIRGVTAKVADVRDFSAAEGMLITNPPYGERLLDANAARELCRALGRATANNPSLDRYVITPDEDFEREYGEKAGKKRKLYNGMIKTCLYMYFNEKLAERKRAEFRENRKNQEKSTD